MVNVVLELLLENSFQIAGCTVKGRKYEYVLSNIVGMIKS